MAQTARSERRTQAERTAESRASLIDAAIQVIHRLGYGGATTAAIAQEAGISRALITFHFGTRSELMAQVLRSVFEAERDAYAELRKRWGVG